MCGSIRTSGCGCIADGRLGPKASRRCIDSPPQLNFAFCLAAGTPIFGSKAGDLELSTRVGGQSPKSETQPPLTVSCSCPPLDSDYTIGQNNLCATIFPLTFARVSRPSL